MGEVASIEIVDGPPVLKSENARLNGWTFIDIEGVDVGSYVENAKQYLAQNLTLPAGYSIRWAGQYEYVERAKDKLKFILPLTLAIIVILLYLNFKLL